MYLDSNELKTWIAAQFNYIQGIMSIPVTNEEEATRYAKCQGGIDILAALVKALNDKSDNAGGQAQAETTAEEPA